ncbi:LGFP repeat-containing protein [Kineococcus arenarius]|uniref:LGFP repeat-containing protein n=1 Tax=Kineococcus sp. SYSU DK007 TaxID=3383128 RepID=UPI003D7CE73B
MKTWKTRLIGVAAVIGASLSTAVPAQADPRVGGEIGYRYEYYYGGARGFLGDPLTGEIRTPDSKGAYVVFQHGSIYWSPWTGAREVHGEIRDGWGRLGWEGGRMGFPTSDEQTTYSRRGKYQEFEGGTVYWTPWTGAHGVGGAIEQEYEDYYSSTFECCPDAEEVLGFPVTSEITTPNGRGAYNHFQWGSIYWSPGTGAHAVHGAIRDIWAAQGWENGRLGFPTSSEEYDYYEDVVVQSFEGGAIWWWPGGSWVQYY